MNKIKYCVGIRSFSQRSITGGAVCSLPLVCVVLQKSLVLPEWPEQKVVGGQAVTQIAFVSKSDLVILPYKTEAFRYLWISLDVPV